MVPVRVGRRHPVIRNYYIEDRLGLQVGLVETWHESMGAVGLEFGVYVLAVRIRDCFKIGHASQPIIVVLVPIVN